MFEKFLSINNNKKEVVQKNTCTKFYYVKEQCFELYSLVCILQQESDDVDQFY